MTRDRREIRETTRAVLLAAIMIVSVFGGTMAFAGSAAAEANLDAYEQPDPGNFDYAVTSDGTAPSEGDFTGDESFSTVGAAVQAADDAGEGPYSILVFSDTTETNIDQSGGDSDSSDPAGADNPAVIIDGDVVDEVASYSGPEETTITFDGSGATGSTVFDINDGAEVRGLTVGGDWRQFGVVAGENATVESSVIEDSTTQTETFGDTVFVLGNNTTITNNEVYLSDDHDSPVARADYVTGIYNSGEDNVVTDNDIVTSEADDANLPARGVESTSALELFEGNNFTSDIGTEVYYVVDQSGFNGDVVDSNEFDRAAQRSGGSVSLTSISNSISLAESAAQSDETIEVAPGTYNESVVIRTTNITLEGPNAGIPGNSDQRDDEAIINTTGATYGIEPVSDNVTIDGLTIRGESTQLIGNNRASSITYEVKNSVFDDFEETAVRPQSSAEVIVSNNLFNDSDATQGFQAAASEVTATISDNTFDEMTAGVGVGGAQTDTAIFTVEGNQFGSGLSLAAVYTQSGSTVDITIENNTFDANIDGVDNGADEVINANSNWWGSTDGPSGDFNGNGASISGDVTVDPATVDAGSADLTAKFIGIVKDDSSELTVRADEDAGFNIEELDEPATGTLVVDIAGQEYVFEDALDDGEVVETDSTNGPTDIADTTTPGFTNISVAGHDGATAIEQTGEVNLVHEARNAPQEGYFLTSMPQSGGLSYQGIDDVTQWDGVDDEYQSFDDSNEVDSVHRGIFMNATSADARYGYTYDTDASDTRAQVGSKELDEGWHVLSSNYNISDTTSTNLDRDLNTQSLPSSSELVVYDESVTSTLGDDTGISEYQAYYVFVHQDDTRPIILPAYNATDRGTQT